jgi:hypothetical protein
MKMKYKTIEIYENLFRIKARAEKLMLDIFLGQVNDLWDFKDSVRYFETDVNDIINVIESMDVGESL